MVSSEAGKRPTPPSMPSLPSPPSPSPYTSPSWPHPPTPLHQNTPSMGQPSPTASTVSTLSDSDSAMHPKYFCPPSFRINTDTNDDSSLLSNMSVASLLGLTQDPTPAPKPMPELLTRRPTNPSRLNADWQALFRDSLIPTAPVPPVHPDTPPTFPPPIRVAPNDPVGHDF
jgi:hypothetical protein